jgi:hypothetical protein
VYAAKDAVATGWVSASETWTYVSTDDPTGIFKVNANVTAKYSAGMRIKFTNGGNVIKGIITVVNAYGADAAGYTYIKFLHEIDPTDSLALVLMANSAITLNYYSTQKAPQGFPLNKTKWSVVTYGTTMVTQNNPASGVYYNFYSLSVPIGLWDISMSGSFGAIKNTDKRGLTSVTLSTSSTTGGDTDFTCFTEVTNYADSIGTAISIAPFYRAKTLDLTAKTSYYMNLTCPDGIPGTICLVGHLSKTEIKAVCAYL